MSYRRANKQNLPGRDARLAAIDRLRLVAVELASGRPVRDMWLGECLDRFLREPSSTLEEAFGLASSRGKETWRTLELRALRRRSVRLAEQMIGGPGLCERDRVRLLRSELGRYRRRWDRRDRFRNGKVPAEYLGKVEGHLFQAFEAHRLMNAIAESDGNSAANRPFPMSEKWLRKVISD